MSTMQQQHGLLSSDAMVMGMSVRLVQTCHLKRSSADAPCPVRGREGRQRQRQSCYYSSYLAINLAKQLRHFLLGVCQSHFQHLFGRDEWYVNDILKASTGFEFIWSWLFRFLAISHWETKGRFRKRVVLANVPSFRFSFQGNMRMYPRSGFRSG